MWRRRGRVFQAAVTQAGDNLGWEGRGEGPSVPGRSDASLSDSLCCLEQLGRIIIDCSADN